jgi:hypothetical protein
MHFRKGKTRAGLDRWCPAASCKHLQATRDIRSSTLIATVQEVRERRKRFVRYAVAVLVLQEGSGIASARFFSTCEELTRAVQL